MADDVKGNKETSKDLLQNREIGEAKEKLLKNNITQNSIRDDQNNKEIKQQKQHLETELDPKTNNYKNEQYSDKIKQEPENYSEIKQKLHLIVSNSFRMRRQVLEMELNVVKTFSVKELFENDDDILEKIHFIENHLNNICDAPDINNFGNIKNDLLIVENLSTELMKKIKKVIKKKAVKKEVLKHTETDIEVPDYRSIVTVRGTEEDVKHCILKAKIALQNGKYDRAESLLMKAERIIPTKNARTLLKQVQAARVPKQNSEPVENDTTAAEQDKTVKEEESKSEAVGISAAKCLMAFENAFGSGNLKKAEQMLKKAKRFDPSLDVEDKLYLVKAAISNKIIEENRKQKIEKTNRECKTAGECLYNYLKAYNAGNLQNAEQFLLQAKTFDPMLNLEPELSEIRTKMKTITESNANYTVEDIKNKDKVQLKEIIPENCSKCDADYLHNGKKSAYRHFFENKAKHSHEITPPETLQTKRDLIKQARAAEEPKMNPNPIKTATKAADQVNTVKEEESKSEDRKNAVKSLAAFEKAINEGDLETAEQMLNKAKRLDSSLGVKEKLSHVNAAINLKIINEEREDEIKKAKRESETASDLLNNDPQLNLESELSDIKTRTEIITRRNNINSVLEENKDKTEAGEIIVESDKKCAADYLCNAIKFKECERNSNIIKTSKVQTMDLETNLSNCRPKNALRSSTEGKMVIPEKVFVNTGTIYTKEHVETCVDNIRLDEIESETKLVKSYYPSQIVDDMHKCIEKNKVENQAKPSHEMTISETKYPCLEIGIRKEIEVQMQTEVQRKETVEMEIKNGQNSDEVLKEVRNNTVRRETSVPPPQPMKRKIARVRLSDSEQNDQRKEEVEKGESRMRNDNKLKINKSLQNKDKTEAGETIVESDKKRAADYLCNAIKFKECEQNSNIVKTSKVQTIDLETNLSNCRPKNALRFSTEGKMVISEKVFVNTGTIYTKEHVETCVDNIRLDEIESETKLVKSYYPSQIVDDMHKCIEKNEVENQAKPSREMTISETEYPRLEIGKRKEKEVQMIQIEVQRKETVEMAIKNGQNSDEVVKEVRNNTVRRETSVPPPQPMKRKIARVRLSDSEQNDQRKEEVEKGKSWMKNDNELKINKSLEDWKEKNRNKRVTTDANGIKSGEDDEKETSIKVQLNHGDEFVKKAKFLIRIGDFEHAKVALLQANDIRTTTYVNSLIDFVDKCSKKTNKSNHNFNYNAELKSTRPSPKKDQTENLVSMAEKAVHDEKYKHAMNLVNTAEEHSKSEILFSRDGSYENLDYYESPVKANVSNEAKVSKCNDEHIPIESPRIGHNQEETSFFEIANVSENIEQNDNEYFNHHSLINEESKEYKKYIDLTTKAEPQMQLKHIQVVRASHPTSDEATASKTVKSYDDLKREADMLVKLAVDTMTRKCKTFRIARHYLECALEISPNEQSRGLLLDVKRKIEQRKERDSLSSNDVKREANRLLNKVESCIRTTITGEDLEEAEFFLITSWDMYRSRRTKSVHKKFLKSRISRSLTREVENIREGRNGGYSDNVYESDKLVLLALDKYKKKQFEEAKKLLTKASVYNPSDRIDQLFADIRRAENKRGTLQKWFDNFKKLL